MVRSLIDTRLGTIASWVRDGKVHYSDSKTFSLPSTVECSETGLSPIDQRAAVATVIGLSSDSGTRFSSMTCKSADLLTAAGADREERPTAKSAPSGVAMWHVSPFSGPPSSIRLEWVCNRPLGNMPIVVLSALGDSGILYSVLVAAKDTPVTTLEIEK